MAVNKNFVVKNGLEVDTNTLFVDSANNRVAIGTTVPTATLDVRGKILSDSQVESFVGKFVGIVTAGAVGVTTMTTTDAVVSGFSTLGKANATSLNVTTGFSTVQSLTATDLTVSIGTTITKDLNVGAAATVGAALTVTGGAKIAEDSRFEKSLEIGGDLNVGGATTIGGPAILSGDINVSGASTVGGALTVTGGAYFNGDVDVNGSLSFSGGDLNVNSATISGNSVITGIATIGFTSTSNAFTSGVTTTSDLNVVGSGISATNLFVSGISTTNLLNVGLAGTMVKVIGIPTTRVGLNSVGPAFTLDVDGDINSTGSIRVNGVALPTESGATTADATALAIALG